MGSKGKIVAAFLSSLILILLVLLLTVWKKDSSDPQPSGKEAASKKIEKTRQKRALTREKDAGGERKTREEVPPQVAISQCIITGTVRSKEDGEPIPFAEVLCKHGFFFTGWQEQKASCDEKGIYRIEDIPPGVVVKLRARANGFAADKEPVTLNGLRGVIEQDLSLEKGLSISGYALKEGGGPQKEFTLKVRKYPPGFLNTLHWELSHLDIFSKVTCMKDGHFRIDNLLAEERYTLLGLSHGFPPAVLQGVASGSKGVELIFKEGSSAISGIVIFEDTQMPVPNHLIRLYHREFFKEVHAGEDGTFVFSGLAPGSYCVKGETDREKKLISSIVDVNLKEGEEREGVKLSMIKGFSISGRTVDRDTSNPLPRVPLVCAVVFTYIFAEMYGEKTVSDEDGNFTFQGPFRETDYAFSYFTENYDKVLIDWIYIDKNSIDDVLLEVPYSPKIKGTVLDPEAKPLKGAWLLAFPADESAIHGAEKIRSKTSGLYRFTSPLERVYSKADGSFTFWLLPPGEYTLEAIYPSFAKAPTYSSEIGSLRALIIPGNTIEDFNVHLKKGPSLYGTVQDEAGAPVEGVYLDCKAVGNQRHYAVRDSMSVRTKADGSYRFESVWSDLVKVSFRAMSGHGWEEREVPVPSNKESIRKDFTLPLLFSISGRLLDSNRDPLKSPPFSVSLREGEKWYTIWPKEDGSFSQKVTDGIYELTVSSSSGLTYKTKVHKVIEDVAAGTEGLEIVLDDVVRPKRAVVQGIVLNSVGKPVRECRVNWTDSEQRRSTFVRIDGTFRIECAPGEIRLSVDDQRHGSCTLDPISVKEGELITGVILMLGRGGVTLRVDVVDKDGTPVKDAEVWLSVERKSFTGSDGSTIFENVSPRGRNMIMVRKKGSIKGTKWLSEEDILLGEVTVTLH